MLTLKFQALTSAPKKIKSCGVAIQGKKKKERNSKIFLFVMFLLDKPLKCPKFIYTHTSAPILRQRLEQKHRCILLNTYYCFWSLEDLKLPRLVSLRQLWAAHSQSFILSFIQKPNSSDSLRQQSRIWAGPAPIRLCALLFNYCFLLIFEANLQPKDNKWQSLVALYHRPYCLNQRRCPEKLTFMQ